MKIADMAQVHSSRKANTCAQLLHLLCDFIPSRTEKIIITPTSRIITAAQLKSKGVDRDQYTLFVRMFGRRVELTEDIAAAYASDFNFNRLAEKLLSTAALTEYSGIAAAAWVEFKRNTAPAISMYVNRTGRPPVDCTSETDPRWTTYMRTKTAALADYDRVEGAAWTEYDRVKAVAFARLYIKG